MSVSPNYRPSQSHAALGEAFYDRVEAARFPGAALRFRNDRWARRVGLGSLTDAEWIAAFARFEPLPGGFPQPLALRYHGHQFRNYNPDLGDGRGFLFAQLHDVENGRLLDLGTKGSGQTPWSRFGDGRLTLKGGMREALASEMLEAQGVDTSKTFSLIETGEALERNDEPSPTRAAVLVRLSHSHIRIGTFQRLLYLDAVDDIARLLDYAVQTYAPQAQRPQQSERAAAFFEWVCRRVAHTGAAWMAAGFVHGVLNTDNINITGESFDYGPWRWTPTLDLKFTAAYFDQTGLYSFGRQPEALLWNLARLAECLAPIADKEALEQALAGFEPILREEFQRALLRRLGLASAGAEADAVLAGALWTFLLTTQAPFERFFYDWRGGFAASDRAAKSPSQDFYRAPSFAPLLETFAAHEPVNYDPARDPYFQRGEPCTLLIDEVEALWAPIAAHDDWTLFNAKLQAIRDMGEAYADTAR